MPRAFALGLLLLVTAFVRAEDAIPAKTLADIKAATVFVKLETSRVSMTGSGFVVQANKGSVLIVTNEHVVTPPRVAGPVEKLEVVFRSGSKDEAVYPAEVLAADADRDLAILRVKNVTSAPKPIDLAAKTTPTETMTVYAVGFPFGEAFSTSKGNPAPTIGKGSVSSLRENDERELALIQIDGDINPGNSGGPVLDAKGRLIGVAVARIVGTNIGLAIPPMELTKMLHGRIGESGIRVLSSDKGTAEVEVALQFIDPLEKVSSATIRLVKTDGALPKPSKVGEIAELTGGTTHTVKLSGQKGSVKLKLPLAKHQMQVIYSNEGRRNIRTSVIVHDLSTLARGTPLAMGGSPTAPTPRDNKPLPKPVNPLPNGVTTVGEIKVNSVKVSTEPSQPAFGGRNGAADPCIAWTEDAKGFYAIDHGAETVRRFSFPELKEEAALAVGKDLSWLSLSKEGLVLTVNGSQEAWVLDPTTLKKKSSFSVNKATRVLSAPSLSVCYVFDTGDGPFGGGTLRVADLKTGKKLKEYQAKDFGRLIGLNTPVISTDGKHLFTTGGIEQLMHFTIDGDKVTFVATTERMVSGAFNQPVVSADGKLVSAPSGGGNGAIKGRKPAPYSTYVFDTNNLEEPILELNTGAYPRAIGFDMKTGLIFAQNFQDQLIVLDREGSKLKSLQLGERGEPYQFLPHPDGGKLLVFVPGGTFGKAATVYGVEIAKE